MISGQSRGTLTAREEGPCLGTVHGTPPLSMWWPYLRTPRVATRKAPPGTPCPRAVVSLRGQPDGSTKNLGIPSRREHARQLCARVTAEHARGVTLTTQPFAETTQSLSGSPQWTRTQGTHDPRGRDGVLHLGAVRRQKPLLRATIRKIPPHVVCPYR
jgi:hypothetical protein